jgi:hypothetical protein
MHNSAVARMSVMLLLTGCVASSYRLEVATDKHVYRLAQDTESIATYGIDTKLMLFKGDYHQKFIGELGVYLQSSTPFLVAGSPRTDAYIFVEKSTGRYALWISDWGRTVKSIDKPVPFEIVSESSP